MVIELQQTSLRTSDYNSNNKKFMAFLQSVPHEKVRVFLKSFKDFYSFILCPDCTFEGLRRNHRFVSVLLEVSDITQH